MELLGFEEPLGLVSTIASEKTQNAYTSFKNRDIFLRKFVSHFPRDLFYHSDIGNIATDNHTEREIDQSKANPRNLTARLTGGDRKH